MSWISVLNVGTLLIVAYTIRSQMKNQRIIKALYAQTWRSYEETALLCGDTVHAEKYRQAAVAFEAGHWPDWKKIGL